MEIYLDTVNTVELEEALNRTILSGVNIMDPSALPAERLPRDQRITSISKRAPLLFIAPGGNNPEETYIEANRLLDLGIEPFRLIIKVPANDTGYITCRLLTQHDMPVCVEGIRSVTQALLAIRAGAGVLAISYPVAGLPEDDPASTLPAEVVAILANYEIPIPVIITHLPDEGALRHCALIGVQGCVISWQALKHLYSA